MKRNKWIGMFLALALVVSMSALAVEAKGFGGGYGGQGGRQTQLSAEEFLAQKTAKVDELVAAGKLTAEQAAQIKAQLQTCDGTCDGTGPSEDRVRIGQTYGLAFGGNADGQGFGQGRGMGRMGGSGLRQGMANGNCPYIESAE